MTGRVRIVRSRRWLPTASCLLLLGLSSCGGKGGLHPVKGKVLYQGKPAAGAVVVFHPEQTQGLDVIRPTGVVGADGSFTLSSLREQGAAPGRYTVTITWPEEPRPAPAAKRKGFPERPEAPPDRLKGKFANPTASKLKVEIKEGTNQLDTFHLL